MKLHTTLPHVVSSCPMVHSLQLGATRKNLFNTSREAPSPDFWACSVLFLWTTSLYTENEYSMSKDVSGAPVLWNVCLF